MTRLLILTDHRGAFYSSTRNVRTLCSLDVDRLVACLGRTGRQVEVSTFAELDLRTDLRGVPVLYTSSEDRGLLYKSYLEDVVLALETAGAQTLPSYRFLRAHHNKTMMEALRYQLFPDEAGRLGTRCFGTYEELVSARLDGPWPKVIKSAYGAGADLVAQAGDRRELLRLARSYSRSPQFAETLREHARRLLRPGYHPASLHRQKFVVQNLVPGLAGDFKVLRFGARYYSIYRRNRPGDFRASGSGDLTFDLPAEVEATALLDYAERVAQTLGTPVASLDIGFDGTDFHLIEFQCLHFGSLTAERSTGYHTRVDGRWQRVTESCDLEAVYCAAVTQHLDRAPSVDVGPPREQVPAPRDAAGQRAG